MDEQALMEMVYEHLLANGWKVELKHAIDEWVIRVDLGHYSWVTIMHYDFDEATIEMVWLEAYGLSDSCLIDLRRPDSLDDILKILREWKKSNMYWADKLGERLEALREYTSYQRRRTNGELH